MKTIIITILGIAGFLTVCKAQTNVSNPPSIALYIIKYNSKLIRSHYPLISPIDVDHIELPSKTDATKIYGPFSEDGLVVIIPKDSVRLLNLSMLYDLYNIDNKYRDLPVRIDNESVPNASDLIAGIDDISSVSVNIDKGYINVIPVKKLSDRKHSRYKN